MLLLIARAYDVADVQNGENLPSNPNNFSLAPYSYTMSSTIENFAKIEHAIAAVESSRFMISVRELQDRTHIILYIPARIIVIGFLTMQ